MSKSYGTTTGLKFSNEIETESKFADQNSASFALSPPNAIPSNLTPTLSEKPEVNLHEDYDFRDVFLKHINQILLEEDMEEKDHVHQRSTALEAAENHSMSFLERSIHLLLIMVGPMWVKTMKSLMNIML